MRELELALRTRLEIPLDSPYNLTPWLVMTTLASCALVCFFGASPFQVILCAGCYLVQFGSWYRQRRKTERMFVYMALEAHKMMPHLGTEEILVGILQFWKENNGPVVGIRGLGH